MRRAVLSLDLVLSVLFLFQMFAISDALASTASVYAEEIISKPSCLLVAEAAAYSYSSSSSVFGQSVYYDYGHIDPDTYRVQRVGNRIVVDVYGADGNYSCVVGIP